MITFFYGPNDYEIKQQLKLKIAEFLKNNEPSGLEKYDAGELDAAKLPEILQSVSLFSAERLILIENVDKNKVLWNALEQNLKFLPDSSELIITAQAPDRRTKTFKILQKNARNFEKLKPYELEKWLVSEAKARGGELAPALARKIIERTGDDQWRLSNELNKLLAQPKITAELIEQLVEATPQQSIFELLDAVIAAQPQKAKKLIDELKIKEDSQMFFGLLVKQIHILACLVAGNSADEVVKSFQIHPFVVKKLLPTSKKLSWREMQVMIQALAGLDTQIKSSGQDPWLLVEKTALKIASR